MNPTVRVDADDYVVFLDPSNKTHLGIVRNVSTMGIEVAIDDYRIRTAQELVLRDLPGSSVLANLGPQPPIGLGTVFGVTIEPVWRVNTALPFARIDTRFPMSDEDHTSVLNLFADWGRWFAGMGLFPEKDVVLELRPPGELKEGQTFLMGSYVLSSKDADRMRVYLPPSEPAIMAHVAAHELMHPVWARRLTPQQRTAWTQAFLFYTNKMRAMDNTLINMRSDMVKAGSLAAFRSEIKDTDYEPVFKQVVRHIQSTHVQPAQIKDAIASERLDIVESVWPTALDVVHHQQPLSKYAMKNPCEFFCETGAFALTASRDIPYDVAMLLYDTMRISAARVTPQQAT